MTIEEFLKKATEIHGTKYDYSQVSFNKMSDEIKIYCKECKEYFYQKVSVHINDKCGHRSCGYKNRKIPHKKNKEQFIKEAKTIPGHESIDYSLVDYKDAHTDVLLRCLIHNFTFPQSPKAHLTQKQGCPKCGYEKRIIPHKKTTEQFVQEAKSKWGDSYNYEKTQYTNKRASIIYWCNKCQRWVNQIAWLHLRHGCPYCAGRGIGKHTPQSFIEEANRTYNNFYIYDKVNKLDSIFGIVEIGCPKHGYFLQKATNHLHNNGCLQCIAEKTGSQAENEIANFIAENYQNQIVRNDRTNLNYKEIDIWLPDIKLGIEYHGLWCHCENYVGKDYHLNKTETAIKRGINLIQIFEHEWGFKKEIIQSRILNMLGCNKKIYARKTTIVYLSNEEKNSFLRRTHLQGTDNSSIWIGLKYQGEIVACMTFGKPRFGGDYDYELIRYSSELNTNVIGGASKLFAEFIKNHQGVVVSYADRRWSNGNMYYQLGFENKGITRQGYFYYNASKKEIGHRLKYQKSKLIDMPGYDVNLTEYEIMQLNGYDRVWDAGNIRFVYEI